MREIVLKYFDMVAIAEFGSGTFGKTGTNTVTLFLRRKGENPSLADHYRNRVDCWFEGDFEKDDLFQDSHLLQNYCDKIGVSLDDYKQVVLNSAEAIRAPLLLDKYDIFKEYRKAFETYAEYKNIQKKKISARYSEFIRKAETEKAFYEFLQATEKDKLYFYMLAESQENPVVLVKSPTENKAMKNFLGYEWSSAKGNEGIKYLGANVIDEEDAISVNKGINQIKTPLFNPLDLADETKINSLIRNNYELRITNYENQYTDFVTFARLSDMLDFSRVTFDKALKTTPEKKIEVSSKYPIVKLEDVAVVETGNSAPQNRALFEGGKYPFFRTSDVGKVHLSKKLTVTNDYLNDKGIEGLKLFSKGTILIPKSGASTYLNHRVVMGIDGYVSAHLAAITADNNKILTELLYELLVMVDAREIKANNDYPSLNEADIKNIKIPLPPLDIQQAIVTECTKIDDEFNASRKTIEENKRKIAEIFENLNEIYNAKRYNWQKLRDMQILINEFAINPAETPDKEFIYIDIDAIENGTGNFSVEQKIFGRKAPSRARRIAKSGSIIISTVRPNLKGFAFIETEIANAIYSTGFAILQSSDENVLLNKWIYFCFMYADNLMIQMIEAMPKGQYPSINKSDIENLKIPVPPLSVQQEIVAEIEGFEAQIAECQKTMNEAADKKKAVLEKYL